MRYSQEYKMNCIELYRQGKWPETPDGVKEHNFKCMIRRWSRMEEANDSDVLKHKNFNKNWTPEEKLELVEKVLAGRGIRPVADEAGVSSGQLNSWVRKYRMEGYEGLTNKPKGRPPKEPRPMIKKKEVPRELTESEREELIRLRAENEYLRAETAAIKKLMALRREKEAARLEARKQKRSKSSETKDTD